MKKLIFLIVASISLFANKGEMQILQPFSSTCPKAWLDDMKTIAKNVEIVTVKSNKGIKREVGVPVEIQSCNTSFLNDFVFEGNVPVKAIKEFFLSTPKDAIGLALPAAQNDKTIKTVYIFFDNEKYEEFGKYK